MAISGSRAVMMYYTDLRLVGAQVRKILMLNAAEKWGVDPASLRTEPGVVVDPANGSRLTYGEIAAFGRIPATPPAVDKTELKPKSEFRLIGKSVPRRDIPLKVNGSAQYPIDVRLPGMAYATALHSPAHGNAPESWNDAEVKAMPGVIATLKLADGIALAAETYEQAIAARAALKVTWATGKTTGFDSVRALEDYVKIADDPAAKVDIVDAKGDAAAALAGATKRYRAEYFSDYAYHAQMEPLNAVARFNAAGDRLEVWDGSQDLGQSRAAAGQVAGSQARTGRGPCNAIWAAASVAAAIPTMRWKRRSSPVRSSVRSSSSGRAKKILRTACSVRRPIQRLEAAIDAGGKVAGWRHSAVGDDGGSGLVTGGMKISPYYALANQHLELRNISHGVRIEHWRAVAHNFNLFAIEGFVDEMAAKEGVDPVDFRLDSMALTPKARAVVEKVAQMSDWKGPRAARQSPRVCDGGALRFARGRRGRGVARSRQRQAARPQSMDRHRRRHHRDAGGCEGQYRERHRLRSVGGAATNA